MIVKERYFVHGDFSQDEMLYLKSAWKNYVAENKIYKGQQYGSGRGIVITAGGLKYFTAAVVLISNLRRQGCRLPIELWHYKDEITQEMQDFLTEFQVTCLDLNEYIDVKPHGFLMKSLSIVYSNFKEVLYLDTDNICVQDPTFLFDDENYQRIGCMFWPDYWHTSESNPIWSILDLEYAKCFEQDSGQLLIDKSRCWKPLQLSIHFNLEAKFYYKLIYGDKDTFRFAWMALEQEFYMVPHPVASCGIIADNDVFYGNTMVQHDPEGNIQFLHRNLLKWDITLASEYVWEVIKRIKNYDDYDQCILKNSPANHRAIDFYGEVIVEDAGDQLREIERQCLECLESLRTEKFYQKALLEFYLTTNRK